MGQVSHYMPPHIGGLQRVAAALEGALIEGGHDVRWVASAVPAGESGPGRVRVRCWDGLNRRFGVPMPVWGRGGHAALKALCGWADVVVVHGCLYPSSVSAVAAARLASTPVLLVQHTGPARYERPPLDSVQAAGFGTVGRAVLAGSAGVVSATPAAEALMAGLGVRARRIDNGVDTARFRPATAQERAAARGRLGLSGRVALFVGRLIDKKGVRQLMAMAARLPTVTFLVVGEGPMARRLEAGLSNVVWRERVEWGEMAAVYHAADLLVLPARGEGFPLVVQEAMASGLAAAVLGGELFAAPLVREGALLGVSAAVDDWVRVVAETQGEVLARVGDAGRQIAETRWRPEAFGRAYLEELRAITARSGGPRARR